MNLNKVRFLNGNHLKILACVLMLIDHLGYLVFKDKYMILRDIGRVSMPLFAYMIAEGCRYTKNKIKHFSLIFILGIICLIVYYIFDGTIYLSILLTFSMSILVVYSMQYAKKCLFDKEVKVFDKIISILLFASVVTAVYLINTISYVYIGTNYKAVAFEIDYGFWGCMLPAFVALFDFRGINVPKWLAVLDNHYIKLIPFALGIVLMALSNVTMLNEWYALIALVPLLFYSGQRGKVNLKYFFYIFYPLHLVLLQGIAMMIG